MVLEMLFLGAVGLAIVGLVEASVSMLDRQRPETWTAVAAVREAMRGREAGVLRSEFRRAGIVPPEATPPVTPV